METPDNAQAVSLDSIPANRRVIDALFAHGIISSDARRDALELLYPARNWGLWASRLLLTLGAALVLSGIVYFFAFNWNKVPVAAKFGLVEGGLFGSIIAAYLTGLRELPGKILLLSAAVLVGVFMAVFGQVYQTGADAYTLFMMWALVILPWVIIGEFAPLWGVWLVVANLFIYLYVEQTFGYQDRLAIEFSSLIVFNGAAVALREFFADRWPDWLAPRWTRFALIVPTLFFATVPVISYIFSRDASPALVIAMMLGLATHAAFFLAYRVGRPDIWAFTTTLLSACILLELSMLKALILGDVHRDNEAATFLIVALATLAIFTGASVLLRATAASMGAKNV